MATYTPDELAEAAQVADHLFDVNEGLEQFHVQYVTLEDEHGDAFWLTRQTDGTFHVETSRP